MIPQPSPVLALVAPLILTGNLQPWPGMHHPLAGRQRRLSCLPSRASVAGQGSCDTSSAPNALCNPSISTVYTIEVDETHPDVRTVARKHVCMEHRFIDMYPIAAHTQQAFREAAIFVREFYGVSRNSGKLHREPLPVILDSGCGTGRSSLWLAEKFPDIPVLGIDKSAIRLSKSTAMACHEASARKGYQGCEVGNRRRKGHGPHNLLLVRANLVDFWLLATWHREWEVRKHYILYPNPYPKSAQLKLRWHGHPVFPTLLRLGGQIIVRSNWKTYLQEMCLAVVAVEKQLQVLADAKPGGGGIEEFAVGTAEPGGVDVDQLELESVRRAEEMAGRDLGMVRACRGIVADGGTQVSSPAYSGSACAGPQLFVPTTPVTNFEAKYKAVGEAVFELILEPS
ncbi:unnamed protein product [Discosporangium mesarthrocarpum]